MKSITNSNSHTYGVILSRNIFPVHLLIVIIAIALGLTIVNKVSTAPDRPQGIDPVAGNGRPSAFAASAKQLIHELERERRNGHADAVNTISAGRSGNELSPPETTNGVDPAFNARLEDGYTRVHAVAVQPDGKIVVGGLYTLVNGERRNGLVRLNVDGSIDAAFNQGNLGPGGIDEVVVLADNKIIISGTFSAYNGVLRNRIARLNPDGSLDDTFVPGGGATNAGITDVWPLANGKLLVTGGFTTINGIALSRIAQLNIDGSIDAGFIPPVINNAVQALAVQADGRIIICGGFNNVGGLARSGTARLNANGTHDTTYDPLTNTPVSSSGAVAIQPDGRIIVGGGYAGTLRRVNPNGSLDATFNPPIAPGVSSTFQDLIVLPTGKILVAGFLNDGFDTGAGVVRLNADGSLDNTFTPQITDTYFLEVFSIALTPSGKIVGGGDIYRFIGGQSKHVFQLNADGSLDNSFTTFIEEFGYARAVVRQPDGKMIVGGSFRRVNGTPRDNLVRLNADGTIDPTFTGTTDNNVYTVALQPDGKVLVGGQFRFTNGFETGGGVRLNTNGTIDTGYVLAADVESSFISKILLQPDGKVLASGIITNPRAPSGQTGVYRVNSDGSEDVTFTMVPYVGVAYDGAIRSDGDIYLGGTFVNYASSQRNRLLRLNSNGTVDGGFNTGSGPNSFVFGLSVQADGKILAGGSFSLVNGEYARGIARFNPEGTLDATFDPGLGINGTLNDVLIQPDDKIVIGGSFTVFNNVPRRNLARLNSDGSLDDTFTDLVNGLIYTIERQPDGKTLIGGTFTAVNGTDRFGVARLVEADLTPPANDNFAAAGIISGSSGQIAGSNTNATAEPGEPAHAGIPAAHSVWYRWTAPDTGLFSFTTSGSSFDTTMGVYMGASVSTLTEIASSDDSAAFDLSSRVVFSANEGTQYFIAIDGKNGAVGITNLIWRQAARTYRIYAQTGNGNISPRVPVITATRTSDGSQYPALQISAGVFELDLPVDNATYIVSIGGPDIWSPNTFTLDNSNRPWNLGGENNEDPQSNGFNLVTVARTISATVIGQLEGLSSTNGVTVFLGSESGPNPIAPIPCEVSTNGTEVLYTCQFIVDTRHQVKPSLNAVQFNPVNRRYSAPVTVNLPPGPGTRFVANNAPTFNITGQVTGNGEPLLDATVFLTGSKTHSYFTTADGNYQFNSLPAGGNYTISVAAAGFTFIPQSVTDLQSNVVINMAAAGGCTYTVSPGLPVPASGGAQSFMVNTQNGCPWQVANPEPWITVNLGSGNGTGPVHFTALPNPGMPRTATLEVGGQSLAVTQANGCQYNLAGGVINFPAAGGTSSTMVTATDQGCIWNEAASDYCMIADLSGLGTGDGMLTYTVSSNRGVARSAIVSIGGQTLTIDQEAAPGDHRAKFDFDGDGRSDISVFRPSSGVWYVLTGPGQYTSLHFGLNGDIPVAADYDGDGKADLAVFRPSDGYWYRIHSTNGEFILFPWGQSGDIPVPADYDGDGRTDIAVYRPSTGTWYIQQSTNGFVAVAFGIAEDKPVAADYNGDGKAEIAVFRPSTGTWYLLSSFVDFSAVQFGIAEDVPTPADYDGDGKTDISVYRPSNTFWYRQNSSSGEYVILQFGTPGDKPVPADYSGDKNADIAVFRPSNGNWYIWSCTNNPQISAEAWGTSTDIPIPYPILP